MQISSLIKYILVPNYRFKKNIQLRLDVLKKKRRFLPGNFILGKRSIQYSDAPSFSFMYEEIFLIEIYRFKSEKPDPYIIDAGANIGLATIYFKQCFPDAEIVAFEPDKEIISILKENLIEFEIEDVTVIQKGLGSNDGEVGFISEGADAGRVTLESNEATTQIEIVRLSHYLDREVDLLKIDIEGAEIEVLKECHQRLVNVRNIFIEFHSFNKRDQQLSEILSLLENSNFRYHIENPAFIKKKPFINRESRGGMDLQLNIFAWK